MAKKAEQTTEKITGATPYTIRKLIGKWIVALVLMLLVFGLLADILESFIPWLPGSLTYPGVAGYYLIYMVVWTIRFLLRKKRFSR